MSNQFNQKIKDKPLLELLDIKKNFNKVQALKGVFLRVFKGKAMGILGENGAGKSTLMNILSGVIQKTSGQIFWNGEEHNDIKNIKEAEKLGISIIHQEIAAFNDMSVLDNIFSGHEISVMGFVNYKYQKKLALEIFKELKLKISLNEVMSKLTIAEQQMVEIAKAMLRKSRVIIFDEPTSSLSKSEIEVLFQVIAKLKKGNIALCYISHKLEEIPIVCDYITIIRDGNFIGEFEKDELTEDQIISKMVGRDVSEKFPEKEKPKENVIFKVDDLSGEMVSNISFELYENEILGFSGLVGAKRTELFKTVIGFYPKKTGTVYLNEKQIKIKNINLAIKQGIYYVTEDRKNEGLILNESIKKNITISSLNKISFLQFLNLKKEKQLVKTYIKNMSVKTTSSENYVGTMSGGNQQKVLLSKVFCATPKLIIFDEPTKGVDVGSRREIYDLIYGIKKTGVGIIVISSDLPEIIGLCNRVIVLKDGRIQKTIKNNITPEEVIKYAI